MSCKDSRCAGLVSVDTPCPVDWIIEGYVSVSFIAVGSYHNVLINGLNNAALLEDIPVTILDLYTLPHQT